MYIQASPLCYDCCRKLIGGEYTTCDWPQRLLAPDGPTSVSGQNVIGWIVEKVIAQSPQLDWCPGEL
jgi:hypothetical protein